jgi:hypothetical protein
VARYQVQTLDIKARKWRDAPNGIYARHNVGIAIAGAKVRVAEYQVFGSPKPVRVVRLGRWTGAVKAVVWSSDRA